MEIVLTGGDADGSRLNLVVEVSRVQVPILGKGVVAYSKRRWLGKRENVLAIFWLPESWSDDHACEYLRSKNLIPSY